MARSGSTVEQLVASVDLWSEALGSVPKLARPEPGLVAEWTAIVGSGEAQRLALSGIPAELVIEAISLGYTPAQRDPSTPVVLQAVANGRLESLVDRATAKRLSDALIRFDRTEETALVTPALRLNEVTGLSIDDAVFLLKRSHSEAAILNIVQDRPGATTTDLDEILKFGSADSDWAPHNLDRRARRTFQGHGLLPCDYLAWSELNLGDVDEIVQAQQLWQPTEASDWMGALGVNHQAAADWFIAVKDLSRARSWSSLGYGPDEARHLIAASVTPAEASQWAKRGVKGPDAIFEHRARWTPPELDEWDGWDPGDALAWSRKFDNAGSARPWRATALPLTLIERVRDQGWLPDELEGVSAQEVEASLDFAPAPFATAQRQLLLWQDHRLLDSWRSATSGLLNAQQLDEWYQTGLSLESVQLLLTSGLRIADALAFSALGLTTPTEQERVISRFGSPEILGTWLEAGFSMEAAEAWSESSFAVDEASGWRASGTPVKTAQTLHSKGIPVSEWLGYHRAGVELGAALLLAEHDLDARTFVVWQDALGGLAAQDVLAWFVGSSSLEDALVRIGKGDSPLRQSDAVTTDSAIGDAGTS